jgi:hypothetical protein
MYDAIPNRLARDVVRVSETNDVHPAIAHKYARKVGGILSLE